MHNCDKCDKSFDSHRKLNAHKSVHREGGRYSVSRKKRTELYNCKNCGKEFGYKKSSSNQFCCITCSSDFQKKLTFNKIEAGEDVGIGSIRRYLLEKCGHSCQECGIPDNWNNKSLSLHLDHIDGDSDNNNLNNLRILCPNCHSQTETYGAKGRGSRYKKVAKRNVYLRQYKGSLV